MNSNSHQHQKKTGWSSTISQSVAFVVVTASGSAFGQDGSAPPMPNLWDLAIQGGWFMIPIGVASIVTLAFTFERIVGLRRGRILPRKLIRRLRELMAEPKLDPRKLWEACEGNRSPLADAVRTAVLKTGRPHAELEKAVEDAVRRETEGMTRNLRPINVVASIAPLLGLLGTVQGMIMAFMVTSTTTSTGTAKAQELAHGIYTALVTTFAGLCVAVVSVLLANFLEGRIERLLKHMEAIFLDLLPQLERYEGRIRISESGDPADGGIRVRHLQATSTTGTAEESTDQESINRIPERKTTSRKPAAATKPGRSRKTKPAKSPAADAPVAASAVAQASSGADTLRGNFDR